MCCASCMPPMHPLTHRPVNHLPCWRQAGADPWKVLRQMREKLRLNAAAVQLPMGSEDQLRGLVDLIDGRAFHFEGASGEQVVGEWHAALLAHSLACLPAAVTACLCRSCWGRNDGRREPLQSKPTLQASAISSPLSPHLPPLPPLLTPLRLAEVPLPEDLKASVEAKRAELVEAVAEVDEELGEQFVLEKPIDGPMLRAAVRRWGGDGWGAGWGGVGWG